MIDLWQAVRNDTDPEELEALVNRGAEISGVFDDSRMTPLHVAAREARNAEVLRLLLDLGGSTRRRPAH